MKYKCLIYARQSSGSDDVSESVDNQIENCKKLADKHNYIIKGIYKDLNVSGKCYPKGIEHEEVADHDKAYQKWFNEQQGDKKYREDLGKLLDNLEGVSFIIVDDITRLYRPIPNSHLESHINEILVEHNIKVLQVKGDIIDLSQFDSALISSIRNAINYEQIKNQKEKAMQQFRKMRDEGKMCNGGRGFAVIPLGHGKIQFDKKKSEVVKYCFEEVIKRTPYYQIYYNINKLWADCFPKAFYAVYLKHIIRNPIYCGMARNNAGLLIKSAMTDECIVDFSTWQKANAIIDSRKRIYNKKHSWLPLSGLLRCGHCGASLAVTTENGLKSYICSTGANVKRDAECKKSRIRMTVKDKNYIGLIEVLAPLAIISLFNIQDEIMQKQQDAEQIDKLKLELQNTITKQKGFQRAYSEGVISEDDMITELKTLKDKENKLSTRISVLSKPVVADSVQKHFDRLYRQFEANDWINGKYDEKDYQQAIHEIVKTVTVYREKIIINTIYGSFELPRTKHHTSWGLPLVRMYLSGKEPLTCTIAYLTGKRTELLKHEGLRIITVEHLDDNIDDTDIEEFIENSKEYYQQLYEEVRKDEVKEQEVKKKKEAKTSKKKK